jgi:hypothetical protein
MNIAMKLTAALKPGLGAIEESHRKHFVCRDAQNTRNIRQSAHLDNFFRNEYPNDNRWDYLVIYSHKTSAIYFYVEVHSGRTRDVSLVLKKLEWLKQTIVNRIDIRPQNRFVWILANGNKIIKQSPQAKLLAKSPLIVTSVLYLDS